MTTENEEFDFDFEEEDEIPEDPLELAAAQNELEARCKEANFPVEQRESIPDKEKYLAVGIPCGREHYWIELHSLESFKSLLSI